MRTAPVIFSNTYYRNVVREYGYGDFEFDRFGFELAGFSAEELNLRWLCHHRAEGFLSTPRSARVVTTGFGMSGVPHMGTVGQILGMSKLQQGGEFTQIVLGDLDAYNGKGRSLSEARDLADRFAAFCRRLGYDDSAGVLRSQFEEVDTVRNLYLLSHFADDADFDDAEEDNHAYYASLGIVASAMTFPRKVSLALMASDFITLGQDFDAVLVLLGIDEHKYVRFAAEIARRLDSNTTLRGDFTLGSIYSRLASGFGGHPKMSKSIPESSISVTSTPDQIVDRIAGDTAVLAAESPSFQLINQLFLRDYGDCVDLVGECATNSQAWRSAKAELADYLISVTELW
ncbi:hypothetical protein OH799_35430 [Nocardia sp. NBC_00881]|uniref:hypothetical protein n=1 Tax=Nocardia sp. NBC_00881 TaxID=2975995 RepID=UPI0038641FB8|nr:hypothetical protein OH799_35430 [Nocardia sp. NBC_00881]